MEIDYHSYADLQSKRGSGQREIKKNVQLEEKRSTKKFIVRAKSYAERDKGKSDFDKE